MYELVEQSNMTFLDVKNGNIVKKAEPGQIGAIKREWEVAGKSGESWEVLYKNLTGTIENIEIKELEFGDILNITITDKEKVVLGMRVDSIYFRSFVQKLPKINLEAPVIFNAYKFTPKGSLYEISGISLKQHGEKIPNAYFDVAKEKYIEEYPQRPSNDMTKDERKIYSIQVQMFLKTKLKEFIEKNFSYEATEKRAKERPTVSGDSEVTTINQDDIPFDEISFEDIPI